MAFEAVMGFDSVGVTGVIETLGSTLVPTFSLLEPTVSLWYVAVFVFSLEGPATEPSFEPAFS